ncbi:MAG: NADH-quinone oxidoreductase subunit N [Planctomycetota bacterium]
MTLALSAILASFWLPSGTDFRLFAPELVLVATIAAILIVPLFVGRRPYMAALLAMVGALVALLSTALVAPELARGPVGALTPPGTAPLLLGDSLGSFFKLFICLLLVLIAWLWVIGAVGTPAAGQTQTPAPRLRTGTPEFFVLLLTSAVGMLLMVSTLNLLVILVAIETASLPSYALVATDKRSRLGAEAALKYVTFGAASAAIMVYGMSLLYGRFSTLDLSVMAERLATGGSGPDAVVWLGLIGLGAGIAFKIAAVPMHLWCPDVFEGAPVEVTTWLSIASKAAGLGVLLRIMAVLTATPALASAMIPLAWGVGIVAAVTCTVGNLAALRQTSVKRILAYSSIAHAGYMMMAAAILVGLIPPDADTLYGLNPGVAAVIAYLFVYLAMNLGAFGATALVNWHAGTDHLSAFTGLGRRAPWLAVPLAVCLFALVGLPPLGGFAAKWYLLLALGRSAHEGQPLLWVLIGVAVINTAISLPYYVRIVRQMYLIDDPAQPRIATPPGGLVLVNGCAVALLLLGTLLFSPLGRHARNFAAGIYERAPAMRMAEQTGPKALFKSHARQH